jgi:glycine C-acetyltransferase
MDGDIAPLPDIVTEAEHAGAMVMVDDAHGEGVLGSHGRGIVDHFHLHGRVEIEVGTLSKAFGVMGGFVAGSRSLIEFLRQKSRPYTFSNTMSPSVVVASIEAIDLIENNPSIVNQLRENTEYFRREIVRRGFRIIEGRHPIVPVMLGEAALAQDMSQQLLK